MRGLKIALLLALAFPGSGVALRCVLTLRKAGFSVTRGALQRLRQNRLSADAPLHLVHRALLCLG